MIIMRKIGWINKMRNTIVWMLMGWGFLLATDAAVSAKPSTLLDLPVSSTNNAMYLASVTERPWWNGDWTKRRPLLVSGLADEKDDKAIVDTVIDFGDSVDPAEVRVVTPWETEEPCVCEKVKEEGQGQQSKVRLLFKTSLRPHQNKPFLVYYGNSKAPRTEMFQTISMQTTDDSIRICNGIVDVVFDRNHAAPGLIRSLRILGSTCDTVLFDRATGYAKSGFVFSPDARNGWDKGAVVADNALVKSVRFDCADATVTFSVYAEQPRIDWHYELKRGDSADISMNWAPGNGSSFDDFFYCGKAGKILTQRAGLDAVSDSLPARGGEFAKWLGEGWYAFGERRMSDIVGMAFDKDTVARLYYKSNSGLPPELTLKHDLKRGQLAAGSGAIILTLGNADDFRKIYKRIERPVAVSVGAVQDKIAKRYRIPRLDRDWCCDYNVGHHYGGDSGTAEPLLKDPAWARTVCDRMRSYGSTTVCLMGYPWWMMPIKDKSIYDRMMAIKDSGAFEFWIPKRKWTSWEDLQKPGCGAELLAFTKAIHDLGMGVHTWCGEVPGWPTQGDCGKFMPELNDLAVDLMSERVKCGQDCAYSNAIEGEGVALPKDLVQKNGGSASYWTWKNPQEAFDAFDRQHVLIREFYTKFKAKHPDIPVFLWNSEDGEVEREKFMSEDEGFFDTMVVEMLPGNGFGHVKHVAKRMRSHFNNSIGHTVWHHYYIMNPQARRRIHELEWPFICGVNGYSQESLSYEATDIETSEVSADFFRFAEYTRLGEKVAKMGPVKNLAVYRDPKAYRADVLKKRLGKPYSRLAQQDGRVRAFSEIRNLNYDVIGPKFFTAKDLSPYRVVYIPEDDVLSEDEARELMAYVRNGGSAIVEGRLSEGFTKVFGGLEDSRVIALDKGKILWSKEVKTDGVAMRRMKPEKEMRQILGRLGGVDPYELSGSASLDGNLQAGPEGMFLGLYNSAQEPQGGTVTLRCPTQFPASAALYVLDVKTGVRQSLTNGTFQVDVLAQNTGYYLIGDESFTAVPTVERLPSQGPCVGSAYPGKPAFDIVDITGFKPLVAVEFVNEGEEGKPIALDATVNGGYDVRPFVPGGFDAKRCKNAIAEATIVHFVDGTPESSDVAFESCSDELKALLKRGGSLVFTRTPTGPAARKFLKEVGVFDPNPSAEKGVGDGWATWCGPDGHPYLSSCEKSSGHKDAPGENFYAWRSICDFFQYGRVFGKWDMSCQQSLFKPKTGSDKYSGLIVQDKVLGAGWVVFNENQRSFTGLYDNGRYCRNLFSWITGVNAKEHGEKATAYHGGQGDEWKKR